jgi:ABC-type Fe3+ transport system permease subunit
MLKLIFIVIAIIFIVFVILLPLLGFFVGLSTILEDESGKDWEGARFMDSR